MKWLKARFNVPTTIALCAVTAVLMACGAASADKDKLQTKIDTQSNDWVEGLDVPKFPTPDATNWYRAQQLYANPNTIIWCSEAISDGDAAPIITVPIKGKLTSSGTTALPATRVKYYDGSGEYTPDRRSLDGMYHYNTPPYQYGFTPGGQYWQFAADRVTCTTALSKFQRQSTSITISKDATSDAATSQAEAALKRNDPAGAQRALEQGIGDSTPEVKK